MQDHTSSLFSLDSFLPHGYCLNGSPGLLWTLAISEGLIFAAYLSLPFALGYFAVRRQDFPYPSILWLFAGFILSCGATHLMGVVVLWQPWHWVDALLKAATAALSMATAVALWSLMPRLLGLPSTTALREANERLRLEIAERRRAEEALLEATAELEHGLSAIVDSSEDAIVGLTLEGTISSWNPAASKMLGYSAEEAIGRSYLMLVPGEWAEREADTLRRVGGGEHVRSLEAILTRKDGQRIDVSESASLIKDRRGKVLGISRIVRDITERKLAEREIWRNHQRLDTLLRMASDGIHIMDGDGLLLDANDAFLGMLGYDRTVIGQLHVSDWETQFDKETLRVRFKQALAATDTFVFETRHRRRDGSLLDVEISACSIDVDGQRCLYAASRDITGRRQADENLRESERRFRSYFDLPLIGIAITSLATGWLDANERLCQILGYSRAELLGKTWTELTHPDDLEADLAQFGRVLAGEIDGYSLEKRFLRKAGGIVHIDLSVACVRDAQGAPQYFVALLDDITEQKRLAEELDKHRRHLEELVRQRTRELEEANKATLESRFLSDQALELARAGYWCIDFSEGDTHYISSARTVEIFGDPPKGNLRYHIMDDWYVNIAAADPAAAEATLANYLAAVAGHAPRYDKVHPYRRPSDGRIIWIHVMGTVVRDAEGKPTNVFGVVMDITASKLAEIAISEAKEAAEAATQAKSAFLANMSHEIRTPMNAVLGFCYLLEQRHLEGEALALIRKVHHAGHSLLSLINDILDFSKIEAGRLEIEDAPFRLTELLDDLASIMAAAHDKDLNLIITPPIDADALIGDRQRLQQVLINLLGNAIKFTVSGEVELRIAVESGDERQVRLRFAVRDTGIGISREQQAVIFSAFSQADGSISRRFGGTGLGLAISQQLVELMGGSLRVESAVGLGSEFWFVLPLRRDRRVARTPHHLSRLELLIADGSAAVREALSVAANSLGWIADTADSGEAALIQALARADGERFYDALLFDWKMPGLDGLDAARAIREALKERKKAFGEPPIVIMVPAHSREGLLAQPGMAWANQALNKPVTPSALYNAVADALSQRQQGFPASQPPSSAAVHGRRIPGVRVLVVDDSDINQEVAKGILEADGAVVHLANDGQDAVEWLEAHPDAVDIVLMDVQMPRLDGYAATRRIRQDERWKDLPIIALTAGAYQVLRDAAQESGMNDFIAKPFNVEQMMALIQSWTGCRPESAVAETGEYASASPPTPESGPAAPALPGIDLAGALRQWGKAETYRTYLDKFVTTYAQAGETIAAYGRQGDFRAAAALAHKLCGVAGTLGLPEVAALARDLETRLKRGEPAVEVAADLQAAIAQVCAASAGWKSADSAPSAPKPVAANGAGDGLVPLFQGLLDALDHNDPDATENGLARLRDKLDDAQLAEVEAFLVDFDFPSAKASARSLMRRLKLLIEE